MVQKSSDSLGLNTNLKMLLVIFSSKFAQWYYIIRMGAFKLKNSKKSQVLIRNCKMIIKSMSWSRGTTRFTACLCRLVEYIRMELVRAYMYSDATRGWEEHEKQEVPTGCSLLAKIRTRTQPRQSSFKVLPAIYHWSH